MNDNTISEFDKRCAPIHKTLTHFKGELPVTGYKAPQDSGLLSPDALKLAIASEMKTMVNQMDSIRKGNKDRNCVDISFEKYMKTKLGFSSWDSVYQALQIDPSRHTIESLYNTADVNEGFRWLIPEIYRAAIQLGLRRMPIYPNIIAAEETVSQMSVIMPYIEMSDSMMTKLNEGETIPYGTVKFNQRDVKIRKMGTGIRVTDEVIRHVSLNIVSLYLQDVGVKLGLGLDTEMIDVLINGDTLGGGFTAPVVGVDNPGTGITYRDMLRVWVRMARLGRGSDGMLTDETQGIDTLELEEFKGANYNNSKMNINLRTPLPQTQALDIHGAMPTGGKIGFYDQQGALIKLNSTGLLVESQRIAEKQTTGTYVTITTGFARTFRDGFVLLDGTLAFSGFPSYMNVDAAENVTFKQ